ncbi:hypothetical protein KUTeg_002411 [Tegillarca granosa]|uniref:VWFC domain-containing protein n=1 Tax=Tegillarca granosa TaxID=220873 RepID=A0ABQ9FU81_TEGGR|nr:hypothetical protein KUTeg_002411 [Tegillarca granosa]
MCLFRLIHELQRPFIYRFLFGLYFIIIIPMVLSQLTGSIQKCKNEGEEVYIPLISDNPCISCTCENQEVRCKRQECPSLEGCYMIIFENFKRKTKCCEVCKGCNYNGKYFSHNQTWTEADDPCVSLTCRITTFFNISTTRPSEFISNTKISFLMIIYYSYKFFLIEKNLFGDNIGRNHVFFLFDVIEENCIFYILFCQHIKIIA